MDIEELGHLKDSLSPLDWEQQRPWNRSQPLVRRKGVARKNGRVVGGATDDDTLNRKAAAAENVPGAQAVFLKTFGCAHNTSDSEYMEGLLGDYGYKVFTDESRSEEADIWVVNTCTVKNPSQNAMSRILRKGKELRKGLVVAGCIPQGDRHLKELDEMSLIGVNQIDRIVEVVEETAKGNRLRLLSKKELPSLDLPKIRKNPLVEIIPLSTGCLGSCTYCKTKHARGTLGSYSLEAIRSRVEHIIQQGEVREIWLSSEDTGAYGIDLGTSIVDLLRVIIVELEKAPRWRRVMLRVGMTNPPYILKHLQQIAQILKHPCVYEFLHVPVQSGNDRVLEAMRREYTVAEFEQVADTLLQHVPEMTFATDVICGFPTETDEEFDETVNLIAKYQLSQVHISQFYARPGTPAAAMPQIQKDVKKARSTKLTREFESFWPYRSLDGKVVRVWITDKGHDGTSLLGHTKQYVQVLIPCTGPEIENQLMGASALVKIHRIGRWSVFGEVVEVGEENDTWPDTAIRWHSMYRVSQQSGPQEKLNDISNHIQEKSAPRGAKGYENKFIWQDFGLGRLPKRSSIAWAGVVTGLLGLWIAVLMQLLTKT